MLLGIGRGMADESVFAVGDRVKVTTSEIKLKEQFKHMNKVLGEKDMPGYCFDEAVKTARGSILTVKSIHVGRGRGLLKMGAAYAALEAASNSKVGKAGYSGVTMPLTCLNRAPSRKHAHAESDKEEESDEEEESEEEEEEEAMNKGPAAGKGRAKPGQKGKASAAAARQDDSWLFTPGIDKWFLASETWAGPKPNMVFRNGPLGQGYYLDNEARKKAAKR